jgi:hypothetical protein
MRRRRLRKQKPPKRSAAAKAAKETEKADAVEKALQEEANERNHAFDNEKRSDLENMKAAHVGQKAVSETVSNIGSSLRQVTWRPSRIPLGIRDRLGDDLVSDTVLMP